MSDHPQSAEEDVFRSCVYVPGCMISVCGGEPRLLAAECPTRCELDRQMLTNRRLELASAGGSRTLKHQPYRLLAAPAGGSSGAINLAGGQTWSARTRRSVGHLPLGLDYPLEEFPTELPAAAQVDEHGLDVLEGSAAVGSTRPARAGISTCTVGLTRRDPSPGIRPTCPS